MGDDAIWELAEFAIREAYVLRSFIEYLKISPESDEKRERLRTWRKQIGLQLGNPKVADQSWMLLQKARELPPQECAELLRESLNILHASYF